MAAAVCRCIFLTDSAMGGRGVAAAAVFSFASGMGVYLLDRVKLSNSLLDPADAMARPEQHTMLTANATRLRAVVVGLLVLATLAGAWLSPWLTPLPILSAVGVVTYAGNLGGGVKSRTQRRRIKDLLGVKNGVVAAGITCFALFAAWAASGTTALSGGRLWLAAVGASLLLRVAADAALCDIDDWHADSQYGTRTLATELSPMLALRVGLAVRGFAAVIVLAAGRTIAPNPLAGDFACLLATATGLTTLLFLKVRPTNSQHFKAWVDAVFVVEVAVAYALARWG